MTMKSVSADDLSSSLRNTVEERFSCDPFSMHLGLEVVEVRPGSALLKMTVAKESSVKNAVFKLGSILRTERASPE
jgi:acyl-coenzyme A thioesterase PaaI-like protein